MITSSHHLFSILLLAGFALAAPFNDNADAPVAIAELDKRQSNTTVKNFSPPLPIAPFQLPATRFEYPQGNPNRASISVFVIDGNFTADCNTPAVAVPGNVTDDDIRPCSVDTWSIALAPVAFVSGMTVQGVAISHHVMYPNGTYWSRICGQTYYLDGAKTDVCANGVCRVTAEPRICPIYISQTSAIATKGKFDLVPP